MSYCPLLFCDKMIGMKYFLQTQIGVENITEVELERKFKGQYSLDYVGFVPHKNGIVQIVAGDELRHSSKRLPLDFYKNLHTIEDAFFVLDYVKDIEPQQGTKDITKKFNIPEIKKNLDFFFDNLNPFDAKADFRLVVRKKAPNEFRRIDLQNEVTKFFSNHIPRAKITLEEGTKEIWVTHIKNRLVIAIRLTTKEKRQGYYKTATVHGSLRPSVAYSMAMLAEIDSGKSVWDPFCGAGTIGCEISEHFKFKKLINSDISEEALSAAKENFLNLKSYKSTKAKISFRKEDFFESQNYANVIISNLPFGKQYETDTNFIPRFVEKIQTIKDLDTVMLLHPALFNIPGFQLVSKFKIDLLGHECYLQRHRKIK